jgi:hypothetical protein
LRCRCRRGRRGCRCCCGRRWHDGEGSAPGHLAMDQQGERIGAGRIAASKRRRDVACVRLRREVQGGAANRAGDDHTAAIADVHLDGGQSGASSEVLDVVGNVPGVGREGADPRRGCVVSPGEPVVAVHRGRIQRRDLQWRA